MSLAVEEPPFSALDGVELKLDQPGILDAESGWADLRVGNVGARRGG